MKKMKKKTTFSQVPNIRINKSTKTKNDANKNRITQNTNINSSLLNFSLGVEKYNNEILSSINNCNNKALENQNETIVEKKATVKNFPYPIAYNLLTYNEYDEVECNSYIKTITANSKKNIKNNKCSLFKAKFFKCVCHKLKIFFNEINFSYVINMFLFLLIIYNYVQTYYVKNDLCELQKKLEEAPVSLNPQMSLTESVQQKDFIYRIQKVSIKNKFYVFGMLTIK